MHNIKVDPMQYIKFIMMIKAEESVKWLKKDNNFFHLSWTRWLLVFYFPVWFLMNAWNVVLSINFYPYKINQSPPPKYIHPTSINQFLNTNHPSIENYRKHETFSPFTFLPFFFILSNYSYVWLKKKCWSEEMKKWRMNKRSMKLQL